MNTTMVPQANASVAQREIRQAALRIIGLTVFENIAHTSQRSDQGLTATGVYLPAKAVNVNIDDVGVRLYAHTPNSVKDHRPRDNASGVPAQIFQQGEFLRRQIQNLPASRGFTPEQIEFEIENSQARGLDIGRVISLYEISHPRQQLG
jgi:hypothetical protein